MSVFQVANYEVIIGQDWDPVATVWSNAQLLYLTITSGTFTLSFRGTSSSQTTGPLAYNASIATIQTALERLTSVGGGNVVVSGSSSPYTISFASVLGLAVQPLLTATWTATTGHVQIAPVPFDLTGYDAVLGARDPTDAALVDLTTTDVPGVGKIVLGTTDGAVAWVVYRDTTSHWVPSSTPGAGSGPSYYDFMLIAPSTGYYIPTARGALMLLRSGL